MPNWYSVTDDELRHREDDGLHAILIVRYRQHPEYQAHHEAVRIALDELLATLSPEQRRAYLRLEQALAARRQVEDEVTFTVGFEMGISRGVEQSPVAAALSAKARDAGHDLTASLAAHGIDDHERRQALALVLVAELVGAPR